MRKTSLFSKWLRALQRNNFKITATWEYIRIFCRLFDFSRRMILKKSRKCRKGLCSAEFWSSSSWQCRRIYISCSLSPCWVSGVNFGTTRLFGTNTLLNSEWSIKVFQCVGYGKISKHTNFPAKKWNSESKC